MFPVCVYRMHTAQALTAANGAEETLETLETLCMRGEDCSGRGSSLNFPSEWQLAWDTGASSALYVVCGSLVGSGGEGAGGLRSGRPTAPHGGAPHHCAAVRDGQHAAPAVCDLHPAQLRQSAGVAGQYLSRCSLPSFLCCRFCSLCAKPLVSFVLRCKLTEHVSASF